MIVASQQQVEILSEAVLACLLKKLERSPEQPAAGESTPLVIALFRSAAAFGTLAAPLEACSQERALTLAGFPGTFAQPFGAVHGVDTSGIEEVEEATVLIVLAASVVCAIVAVFEPATEQVALRLSFRSPLVVRAATQLLHSLHVRLSEGLTQQVRSCLERAIVTFEDAPGKTGELEAIAARVLLATNAAESARSKPSR